MRDFLFGHTGVWTKDLWISSPALYHCATATSDFHLWQFQVINSGAEGLVVVLFWLDLWEIFFLATLGFEPGTSGSLVLHSTTAPRWLFIFHLWQFQVFNSGAEGLVVVLFWLDPWEIFFLATPELEPGTSGSPILHSTTAPQQLLIFTSDNLRYLTLVQRDWSWYCSDWTWEIFFLATLGFEPRTSGSSSPALYHCATETSDFHLWQFQVFNSGAEGLVVVLFWLDLWEIFFLATPGFQPGISGSLVLHSTTVSQQLLIFTSDNFRYLTLVQRDWWWYCSDWTCERFSFWPHWGLNLGPLDL